MILWSIQNAAVCKQLDKRGTIRADGRRVWHWFKDSYAWLTCQMKQMIGPPPGGVTYPMWSWYQWEGKRKKPDMRSHAYGHGKPGTPIVLITFDAPDSQVVLSDFDAWHVVLNDGLLSGEDEDGSSREERIASWQNIFDLNEEYLCPEDRSAELTIQATTWEIRKEWIRDIRHYRSR